MLLEERYKKAVKAGLIFNGGIKCDSYNGPYKLHIHKRIIMTKDQFLYWLKGYLDLVNPQEMHIDQINIIKAELEKILQEKDKNEPEYERLRKNLTNPATVFYPSSVVTINGYPIIDTSTCEPIKVHKNGTIIGGNGYPIACDGKYLASGSDGYPLMCNGIPVEESQLKEAVNNVLQSSK